MLYTFFMSWLSSSASVLWSCVFFFFSSRRRHTRSDRDWSSDVCSSDLENFWCRPDPTGHPEVLTVADVLRYRLPGQDPTSRPQHGVLPYPGGAIGLSDHTQSDAGADRCRLHEDTALWRGLQPTDRRNSRRPVAQSCQPQNSGCGCGPGLSPTHSVGQGDVQPERHLYDCPEAADKLYGASRGLGQYRRQPTELAPGRKPVVVAGRLDRPDHGELHRRLPRSGLGPGAKGGFLDDGRPQYRLPVRRRLRLARQYASQSWSY